MKIKCSFNFQWIGKTETAYVDEVKVQMFEGKKVSLGHQWVNVEHDLETIYEAITKEGIPIGPYLKDEANGNRKRDTFESHQIAFVDIDNGMTLQELLEDEFYLKYGGGFYTSPSFTEEHHKFRVFFVLENPVTDVNMMKHLYNGLMNVFKNADVACKDGARLFNGTINAKYRDLTNNVMPDCVVQALIQDSIEEEEEKLSKIDVNRVYEEQTDVEKRETIEALKKIYLGDYKQWRLVGWALRNSGYRLEDFVEVTLGGMMNSKSSTDCKTIWNDCKDFTTNFGVIVNMLKKHGVQRNKATVMDEWKQYTNSGE